MYKDNQWTIYFKNMKDTRDRWLANNMNWTIYYSRSPNFHSDGIGFKDKGMESICKVEMFETVRIFHQIRKQWKPEKKGWIFGN